MPEQTDDMKFLIETVWRCESVLSEERKMENLVLVRWDPSQLLSPHNCILLTRDEAEAHAKIGNKQGVYGTVLFSKVSQRHLVAKTHFAALK
jgi:hypothetical protein